MRSKLSKAIIKRAIKALRYQARDEAGHSQYPFLIIPEDTQAWKDAKTLELFLIGESNEQTKETDD